MSNINQDEQKERHQQKITQYHRELGPKKQGPQNVQKEIQKKQAQHKKHQHKR